MLLVRFVSEAKVIDRHSNNCSLTKSDKSGIQNIVQPSMFLYLSLPVAVSHSRYILVILHTVRKKECSFQEILRVYLAVYKTGECQGIINVNRPQLFIDKRDKQMFND